MKTLIMVTALVGAVAAFADDNAQVTDEVASTNKPKMSVREALRRINMREHGGYVRKEGSAKGVFVVLNAQKKVAAAELDKALSVIDNRIKIQVKRVDVDAVTMDNVKAEIARVGGNAGVAVVEAPANIPALLSATEEGWAMVNVTKLAEGNPDAEILARRVRRETLRGFSFAVGGVYGARGDALMQPVREPKDLDSLVREDFAITMMQTFSLVTPYYDIKPWRERKYDKACEEGWAPAPTNEFQKAIWDKVHTIPKNPMKIEYDPKKGR